MLRRLCIVACIAAAIPAAPAAAACPGAAQVDALVEAYLAQRPAQGYGKGLGIADGLCAQKLMVERLGRTLGPPIGYKVGLSNPEVQKAFAANAPVRGVLMERMLLPDGARVAARFGARPMFEADMLVRVRDAAVNNARMARDVALHVSEIIPFIELPDLVVGQGEPLDAGMITAINVGARLGVAGAPIAMRADPAFVDALAEMAIVLTDGSGAELSRGPGKAVLGHPLNAVTWLAADLAAAGRRLEPGQLVSLGSFSRLMSPKAGQTVTLTYEGLPGVSGAKVVVTFE